MSVKASVSISDQQDKFARKLVEDGRYSSLSAVVQRGLELLREETEMKEAEVQALRALIDERSKGPLLNAEESSRTIQQMIAAKKSFYGL
ncbi:type II toxin-antitoxin system ParD family antitoxin [Agrobacterium vitis]|uniref:type II toxin-antitoxin system ParD family antitoxin n=1 Tax=Agrobacterium vitis TaxID=373 RepID=UPI0012E969B4|nr:type II toxin-antitoxin system ParD family antitoxin [Agrobacterium vitis]MVA18507.1 type II toxin-antitoxin system ParD family antitoxin [Agrobacterium vitis]